DLRGAGTVTLTLVSDGRESNPTTINFVGDGSRDLVINEVLADPPGAAATDLIGDANHDGVRSSSDDEFVELVNATSHDLNLGGSTGRNGSSNQSLTRSPDVTGGFTGHTTATDSGGSVFSPGTRVDSAPFSPCPAIARVDLSPTSATINGGEKQQFTAKAFDAN